MLPYLGTTNELLGEVIGLGNFRLSSIHGLPEEEYFARKSFYAQLESWYSGQKLKATQTQGGRTVDKYPVRINPIRGAVYKHAYALFGEAEGSSKPLAPPILKPDSREDKDAAQQGTDWLINLWGENHGRSLMMKNALLSQILGGCVFKLNYHPGLLQSTRPFGKSNDIQISSVHPANFVGVPVAGDEFLLEEAWVVKAMSPSEASRRFRMDFSAEQEARQNVYYVEYWSPDYYEITVQGKLVPTGERDESGRDILYQGENPDGVVPMVYIPHIRTSTFYGESLITDNITGIVEELNRRIADFGDAVSADAHRYYVIANTSGTPDVYELAPGMRVVQLPGNPSITGKEQSPNMQELNSSQASVPMQSLVDELYKNFRREAYIPAVADGEDEGSQRSGETLIMRMWPLLSHTSTERIIWGDGLALLDKIALHMGYRTGNDIPEQCLSMRIERRWAPVMPRDREKMVNELVNRASAKLGSLEHLLGQLGDIEDPTGEIRQIMKEMVEFSKVEIMSKPVVQPDLNQQEQEQQDSNKGELENE